MGYERPGHTDHQLYSSHLQVRAAGVFVVKRVYKVMGVVHYSALRLFDALFLVRKCDTSVTDKTTHVFQTAE